ncbi:MAG: right-handed parallel beta-helix repeat-containing protein [Myxococcales bacterium]|nr:right-handed parallel beta-helix repeat-containing protein [Myxococcales bacterium]
MHGLSWSRRCLLLGCVAVGCGGEDDGSSASGGTAGTAASTAGTAVTGSDSDASSDASTGDGTATTGATTAGTTTGATTAGTTVGTTGPDTDPTETSDTDTGDTDGEPGVVPASGCPGRLAPLELTGLVAVVGDGSPASCTEQALHDAVAQVNAAEGGGAVTFDCGGPHTITLTQSVFAARSMILDGGGEITLSGGGAVRVIELDHYLDFVLQRITIRDGFVAAGSDNESGAGLLSPWFGTLKVIDATFQDNVSDSQEHDVGGGAIYAGGLTEAVLSGVTFLHNRGSTGGGVLSRSANLRVIDAVFLDNAATSWAEDGQYGNGGGLYIDRMWLDAPVDFVICGATFEGNHAKVHGSAFFSYNLEGSGATFDRCTFRDNDMEGSPDGGTGSVYHQGVPLTLRDSTFAGNVTGGHAGGLFLGSGTNAAITNCTFTDNATAGNAGALWAGSGVVTVTNTTFSGNEADYGPVIFKGQTGSVTLTNVIFADNTTQNEFSARACHETFTDGGGNVQWPDIKNNGNPDTPCAAGALFADPLLEALADNGGPTPTMALPGGSPALDIADACPDADQRGLPRAGLCDAGAYELQP